MGDPVGDRVGLGLLLVGNGLGLDCGSVVGMVFGGERVGDPVGAAVGMVFGGERVGDPVGAAVGVRVGGTGTGVATTGGGGGRVGLLVRNVGGTDDGCRVGATVVLALGCGAMVNDTAVAGTTGAALLGALVVDAGVGDRVGDADVQCRSTVVDCTVGK